MATPFHTIGHGTRPLNDFVELLNGVAVTLVVDVRTVPRSRTNPQYNRETMPQSLEPFGIGYEHIASLGGLRGRAHEVPLELNAFWHNDSFHNYADYALSDDFRDGHNSGCGCRKTSKRIYPNRQSINYRLSPWIRYDC